jgi:anaerobic dimethyl sulfoxide reductase subunit B
MAQYGFFFDQSRCIGCHACAVACKNWNHLPPGPLKYLKIYEYEKGVFPHVRLYFQWIPCYHCERPPCIKSCPTGAIYKEEKYGAILIKDDLCNGCRKCYDVCPYGAPVFESDEEGVPAQKCTMCIDRLEMGLNPQCVSTCPTRALDFGPSEDLRSRYGDNRDLEDLPKSKNTKPAVVFKARGPKRSLVPYDAQRARELMMQRDPLPPVFQSVHDMTDIPEGVVGRDRLIIKHKSAEGLMQHTRNDEG